MQVRQHLVIFLAVAEEDLMEEAHMKLAITD